MTTVAQATVESACLFPTLPACQAHGSWDWEEFQAPRTPAETQALPSPTKGMQRNLLSFYKSLCLPSSFRKMSPSVGHLTMACTFLLFRD